MSALNGMLRLGHDGLGVMDQSLGHPDLPIYRAFITFYGDIGRIFMRLHLTQMRLLLFEYPKLLHVCVKYLASLNVYGNRSTDTVKHVSVLVDIILNS
ncbi:hypothetical protein TNCV_2766421 [Trichonephila clavipes]|nr:hypothetical protein TNCV_2766421 [Trichonephila clavipes]